MKVKREHYKSLKDLPREEFVTPGSPMCAGCGGLTTLRLFHKVLGGNVVVVNAAGCMTLLAAYPFTPLKSSWLYTTMASAAAGAQGIRDALDVLASKGRLSAEDDLKVLVLAGDGSTYDMGLSATSGAIHRGLDFWYLCYDNEAYGNTGFQLSSGSPLGSQTATTPARHNSDQERHFRNLAGSASAICCHRFRSRAGRPGRESRSSLPTSRTQAVSVVGGLPDRLGIQSGTERRDRATGDRNRCLAAEGSDRRRGTSHADPEPLSTGRRVLETTASIPASVQAGTAGANLATNSAKHRCLLGIGTP